MSDYVPYKGVLADGTEVLVSIYRWHDHDGMSGIASVDIAFRDKPHHTWGPPMRLERAP